MKEKLIKCYYTQKYQEHEQFSYCKNCRRAFAETGENCFVPTITKDLQDNKKCISFLEIKGG
jgi:hypothetical protein